MPNKARKCHGLILWPITLLMFLCSFGPFIGIFFWSFIYLFLFQFYQWWIAQTELLFQSLKKSSFSKLFFLFMVFSPFCLNLLLNKAICNPWITFLKMQSRWFFCKWRKSPSLHFYSGPANEWNQPPEMNEIYWTFFSWEYWVPNRSNT